MMVAIRDPSNGLQQRAARRALFFCVSLGVHLLIAGALAMMAWTPWMPKLEVTWLDLDNTLGGPRPAPKRPEPRPQPEAQPKAKSVAKKGRRRARRKRKKVAARKPTDAGVPRTDAGTNRTGLAAVAPGDAALMLLLRTDRIQGSPYEQSVRRLLEVFYDHKTLLWSSGLDPMRDFEALLIATPNPYRVTQTFLAVRHNLPRRRLKVALERSARFKSKRMRWIPQVGGVLRGEIPSPPKLPQDPRVVLMRRRLVMLTDPKHLALLTAPRSEQSPRPDAGRSSFDWVEHLQRMDQLGGPEKEGAPGLLLLGVNLPRLLRLPPDIPPPHTVKVQVPTTDPALVEGELLFVDEQTARAFLQAIPKRIQQAKRSLLLRFLGVTDILDDLKLSRNKEQVSARVKLSGAQVQSLLELFRGMIPQVRVPGMPPRRPPDAGVARPKASAVDAGPPRDAARVH